MRALRIALRIVLAICLLLFAMGLAINLFDLFTFRKTDSEIMEIMTSMTGYDTFIDTVLSGDRTVCYAGVRVDTSTVRDAVFFVHGSPGALDAYTQFLSDERLAALADLYALDRPGFGQTTPKRAQPSLARQSEVLYSLVAKIGARRNILVGHSLGCSIIARFAMDYPLLADGLVMVSAPIDPELEPPNWWRYVLDFPLFRIAVPRPLAISNAELLPLKHELEDCLPLWKHINCPVVFVHGDLDQLVPVDNVAFGEAMLNEHVQQRIEIIEGEGHFILWSHSDQIIDQIIQLLR